MTVRKCLECGDTLRGRADQKFCNDQCRNTHNNKLMGESNSVVRQINRILKKNHLVLAMLNPDGKTTVFKHELVKKGFNFNYFTNTYTTRNGRTYHFCYDQGYAQVEGEKVLLVQKQEYVD